MSTESLLHLLDETENHSFLQLIPMGQLLLPLVT
nr:MAG TPA: hypothetical protein [Caudoviricetes sp.]DAS31955.1 MAG TPA: hypothetical protein [Caudoviricetes sp.]